jgi:TfoX/Sxy family transcriptional regulator of competence genes
MGKTNELCDHVMDLLAPLASPRYRAMFGGYAIYLDERMVAIVAGDVLMLRADEEKRSDYEARGIGPFQPCQRGFRSIAIPPLGAGLGGLDWNEVRVQSSAR